MSSFSDALKGLKQLLLLQNRIEQVEAAAGRIGTDITALADAVQTLNNRVARLEGFIEGAAAAAAPRRARLPRG